MPLVCEDLAQYGVVLVPPSTAEYFELLAEIESMLQARPKGSPPLDDNELSLVSEHDGKSVILINRAPVAIASMAYIWFFPGLNGQVLPDRHLPGNTATLLPFNLDERGKKVIAYWYTIFPGSKRLLRAERPTLGDNRDVRPPASDELWPGGFVIGSGSDPWLGEPLKLILDGVFFVDGGFAGPNRLGAWEETVFAAEAYLACASLAREARHDSRRPADFFVQVEQFTGQKESERRPIRPVGGSGPLDPELIRKAERQKVGRTIFTLRKMLGDEAAIAAIEAWANAPVPKFHKL